MHSFFVAPTNFDVIVVTGQDSARFLQGQLTCDVAGVAEADFCNGAVCNNKGRVIAAFTLIRWQDAYYLCMTAGLGAVLLATLKKYLPFYKCSMQLSSQCVYALADGAVKKIMATMVVLDKASSSANVLATPHGWLCLLDAGFSRAFLLTTQSSAEVQSLLHPCKEASLDQWEALSMLAGHYPFRAADTEQFTPQDLHFDRNGYVSFSKGCYTGQEIVARMHYRGKLKKQLYLLTMKTDDLSSSADAPIAIYDASGEELGHSLVSRTVGQQTMALAQLPITSTQQLFLANGQAIQCQIFAIPQSPGSAADT